VTTALDIPERDLSFSFVRATGPGGQNVNKVASAAQLRFDLAGTTVLDAGTKARLRALAGHRLTAAGDGDAEARGDLVGLPVHSSGQGGGCVGSRGVGPASGGGVGCRPDR